MEIENIKEAQFYFEKQIPVVIQSRQELYSLQKAFTDYYTYKRIQNMPIDHYALGNYAPDEGFLFCHTIEYKLRELGEISGGRADKYGVYFEAKNNKYRSTKKFDEDYQEAYKKIRTAILQLIDSGKNENIQEIIDNPISHMFKGKILSTFYPNRFLNIFSDRYLYFYLTQLNLDTEDLKWSDPVIKREKLLAFKEQDPLMKNWPIDIFSYFLWAIYPGPPPKDEVPKQIDPLRDLRLPKFPVNQSPIFIEQDMVLGEDLKRANSFKESSTNPDYEKDQKFKKIYGDRGEHLVLQLEKERLNHLPNLAKKVDKAKFDYLGYDILSFEENGIERYIEVKSTTAKQGQANFFLSYNELEKAFELKNYWLYIEMG